MPVERCRVFVSGFASVTLRSRGRPSRWTVTVTSVPPSASATASRRSLAVLDRGSAELEDDVAGLHPRLARRPVGVHRADQDARLPSELEVAGQLLADLHVLDPELAGAAAQHAEDHVVPVVALPVPGVRHRRPRGQRRGEGVRRRRGLGRLRHLDVEVRHLEVELAHPRKSVSAEDADAALPLGEGRGELLGGAATADVDRHRPAGRRLADQAGQVTRAPDGFAVEPHDDVALLEAGLLGGAPLLDRADLRPAQVALRVVEAHAQHAAPGVADDHPLLDLLLLVLLPRPHVPRPEGEARQENGGDDQGQSGQTLHGTSFGCPDSTLRRGATAQSRGVRAILR